MHNLRKNIQKLWYSIYSDQITIYERDEDGNIINVADPESISGWYPR